MINIYEHLSMLICFMFRWVCRLEARLPYSQGVLVCSAGLSTACPLESTLVEADWSVSGQSNTPCGQAGGLVDTDYGGRHDCISAGFVLGVAS